MLMHIHKHTEYALVNIQKIKQTHLLRPKVVMDNKVQQDIHGHNSGELRTEPYQNSCNYKNQMEHLNQSLTS